MKEVFNKVYFFIFLIYILLLCVSFNTQSFLFFNGGNDFGADFFNICRYIAERDPYGNMINGPTEHGALPLCYLFQYPFTLFADYRNMTLWDCYQDIWGCMIPFAIYMLFSVTLYVYSIIKLAKYHQISIKYLWPILFSSIFLFTIERGNSILLIAGLINLFIVYYNSKSLYYKILAILFLSIAGVFKVIPGILCLLYIKDKRYKEFILLGIVTLLLLFLPFLFFKGGISNIFIIPERMALQVEIYGKALTSYRFGFMSIATFIYHIVHSPWPYWLLKGVSYLFFFMSILLFWTNKERNTAYIYLMFILALFAGSSNVYNVLYLFPLYLLLFREDKINQYTQNKNIYFILFLIIIQPIQIILFGQSLSYVLANVSSLLLWGIVIIHEINKDHLNRLLIK